MAKRIEFDKFLIIEATARELYVACGSPGICDWCGTPQSNGYYIAVLNQWFCPKCFEDWKKTAKYYPSDRPIEERNFNCYAQMLKCQ